MVCEYGRLKNAPLHGTRFAYLPYQKGGILSRKQIGHCL
jgi:hypothetical protein